MANLGATIDTKLEFDAAIDRVTSALKDEGFGVLTRIDIDRAFEEKLGVEFRRYVILGACNPKLAHAALSSTPEIGLMLPCNVCVEATESGTRVRIIDAHVMLQTGELGERPEMKQLADDAGSRLERVARTLREA